MRAAAEPEREPELVLHAGEVLRSADPAASRREAAHRVEPGDRLAFLERGDGGFPGISLHGTSPVRVTLHNIIRVIYQADLVRTAGFRVCKGFTKLKRPPT